MIEKIKKLIMQACERTWNERTCKEIKQALEQMDWIPCSEKMPKPNVYINNVREYYLVQNEYDDMLIACYDGIGWEQIYHNAYYLKDKIIAWMVLPRKYEESKKT